MTAPRPTGSIDIWNFVDNVTGTTVRKWLRDSWARKKIVALQQAVSSIVVPTRTSQLTNDSGYITQADVPPGSTPSSTTPLMDGTAAVGTENAFARGDHRHPTDTSRQAALSATQMAAVNSGVTAAKVAEWDGITVPTKTSDLTNDSGFITSAPVASVNGQTGAVALDAADVGALPDSTVIPSKTSQLTNDSGFLTAAPVTSVNGKTGAVNLTASDVGALPSSTAIPSKTSDLTNDSGYITASALPSVPSASTTNPAMDGTASAGSSTSWSRGDHVHPHDTSKADKATTLSGYGITDAYTKTEVDGMIPTVPTKTSDLLNDSGFLTSIPGTIIYYGECTTAAAEQTKVVVCPGFSLVEGAVIVVRFTNAQNYSPSTNVNVLMNVNGTGAKQVKRAGTTYLPKYFWAPGQIVPFAYDGTNWVMVSGGIATTTYYGITKLTESLTSTSTINALSASAGKSLKDQIDALSDRITALGG